MSSIKTVKIVKRPRKSKVNITKLGRKVSKGGSCRLDHKQMRGGQCACSTDKCKCMKIQKRTCPGGGCGCPNCPMMMKGGQVCTGERLHGCLRREVSQNNLRAQPQNGSNKDFTLHSKWTRFSQNEGNVVRDLAKTNKRSDVSVARIAAGKMTGGKKKKVVKKSMKKKKGGSKASYTKASLKRVSAATPQYAKKHAKLAIGGKKKKTMKKTKGGSTGYKKPKSRVARINSKKTFPQKPVTDTSRFA